MTQNKKTANRHQRERERMGNRAIQENVWEIHQTDWKCLSGTRNKFDITINMKLMDFNDKDKSSGHPAKKKG